MYLKSLEIKDYRKYYGSNNKISFAHSNWKENQEPEEYISKSSSLLIGKNNAGKSTIINLLSTLQNTKAGSKGVFKHCDFNLTYLRSWYNEHVFNKSSEEINCIQSSNLPVIEFRLTIGIDSEKDYISNFQDVLVISEIKNHKNGEPFDIDIIVKYECSNESKFLSKLIEIENKEINLNNLGLDKNKLSISDNNVDFKRLKNIYDKCTKQDQNLDKEELKNLDAILKYYEESIYRNFLHLLDQGYYSLNFYPLESKQAAKDFSLSSLLKVKTIQANTVKDNNTLSVAYNKIVDTYAKRNNLTEIDDFIDDVNIRLKDEIDTNIKGILENTAKSIESSQNLEINLHPDINLNKILGHSVLYEYKEGKNYIPESQYGMGYTNLMVIIAELVDYFEKYEDEDVNGAINILCIEEPETYMHPEMQELFIKHISKAIASLLPKPSDHDFKKKDTFQVVISTHSSHILNSKIQSGNTLNNIIYLNSNGIVNIEDNKIQENSEKKLVKDNSFSALEYIKKYIRLELSDIFYADAVILVEGQTEETYLRYLIDENEDLNSYHIKVYRIDGAYGFQFIPLLKLLNIPTIILTDLDLNRTECERKNYIIINNLNFFVKEDRCITTNETIKKSLCESYKIESQKDLNNIIASKIGDKEVLKIRGNNLPDNIQIYSQGKINGNYATSFEEAVILTNSYGKGKDEILELLKVIHPKLGEENEKKDLIKNSYFWQNKLSNSKSKFSNLILYKSIIEPNFKIDTPKYIKDALESIKKSMEEN